MNRWKAALALTALWTSTALAQETLSSTVYFPTGTNVLRVYSSKGYNAYKNSIGRIAQYVTRDANLDSLQEQKWSVTVTRQINIPQHIYEVLIEGVPYDPTQTIIYKDTINIGGGKARLYLPDKDTRTTIGGSPFPFNQDSIFSIYAREDTLYAGDKTEILFTRLVPVEGLKEGAVYTEPSGVFDTLTVATYDTLLANGDTSYSAVIAANQGTVSMFLDAIPITSTATRIGVGLQYKRKGSNVWYGSGSGRVSILTSDITLADSSYAAQLANIPADSLRVVYWDVNTTGRSIIKRILLFFGE